MTHKTAPIPEGLTRPEPPTPEPSRIIMNEPRPSDYKAAPGPDTINFSEEGEDKKASGNPTISFRLQPEWLERLTALAAREHRSRRAQIEVCLEFYLKHHAEDGGAAHG